MHDKPKARRGGLRNGMPKMQEPTNYITYLYSYSHSFKLNHHQLASDAMANKSLPYCLIACKVCYDITSASIPVPLPFHQPTFMWFTRRNTQKKKYSSSLTDSFLPSLKFSSHLTKTIIKYLNYIHRTCAEIVIPLQNVSTSIFKRYKQFVVKVS